MGGRSRAVSSARRVETCFPPPLAGHEPKMPLLEADETRLDLPASFVSSFLCCSKSVSLPQIKKGRPVARSGFDFHHCPPWLTASRERRRPWPWARAWRVRIFSSIRRPAPRCCRRRIARRSAVSRRGWRCGTPIARRRCHHARPASQPPPVREGVGGGLERAGRRRE